MKYYFRLIYTADSQEIRDAVVGIENIEDNTPIDSIKAMITKVLTDSYNKKNVHISQIWDMGADVDFINI